MPQTLLITHRRMEQTPGHASVPLGFLSRQVQREAMIEHKHHPSVVLVDLGLDKGHRPAIDYYVMVVKGTREANPETRQRRAIMLLHRPPIRRPTLPALPDYLRG